MRHHKNRCMCKKDGKTSKRKAKEEESWEIQKEQKLKNEEKISLCVDCQHTKKKLNDLLMQELTCLHWLFSCD